MGRAEDVAVFQNLCDEYAAALFAGDVSRLSSLWTDDVTAISPNEPMVAGKEACRVWHRDVFDQYTVKQTLLPDELEIAGEWAFACISSSRTVTPKTAGAPTEDTFRIFTIFKRATDGSWKLHRAMWNSPPSSKTP